MIISLLSDYGYQDHYVGITKAHLHHLLPKATVIDVSHDVTPHHVLQCSYLLASSIHSFPPESVHLCLFGMMYTVPSHILIAKSNNQYIITADNGLLPLVLKEEQIWALPQIPADYKEWLQFASDAILQLQDHTFSFDKLIHYKPEIYSVMPKPSLKDNSVECNVIHVDRFGNVVLNITKAELEEYANGRKFRIALRRNEYIDTIHQNYADVAMEEKLCRFNNAGYLEIAINQANAAKLLGLRLYDPKLIIYQIIKIEFI